MTNIKMLTDLVINYFESEHIMIGTPEIIDTINKWIIRTEHNQIDLLSLAALTIENPNKVALSNDEIREIRNFYFPSKF